LITSSLTFAANSVLKETKAFFDDKTFVTELILDQEVASSDILVEYINQTIQLNIPGVKVPKGQLAQRVNQNSVRSVYNYQLDDNIMRSRIIYDKPMEASKFEGYVDIATQGNKIVIRVTDPDQV